MRWAYLWPLGACTAYILFRAAIRNASGGYYTKKDRRVNLLFSSLFWPGVLAICLLYWLVDGCTLRGDNQEARW